MKEYVLVPKEDITKLEQARVVFHNLIDELLPKLPYIKREPISWPMWRLTHTKYKTGVNFSENS